MDITQSPKTYASAYAEALFTLSAAAGEVLEIDLLDNATQAVLGRKRLSGQTSYTVNVAPYAQRLLEVAPLRGAAIGFLKPDKRTAAVALRCGTKKGTATLCAGIEASPNFRDLSKQASGQPVSKNHTEEIALLMDDTMIYAEAVLTNSLGSKRLRLCQNNRMMGLNVLYLPMAELDLKLYNAGWGRLGDFHTLAVQVLSEFEDLLAERTYRIVPEQSRAQRLCWWNRYGQIDYGTFLQSSSKRLRVDKQNVYTAGGYKTVGCSAETRTTLVSDFLNEESLAWLGEVIAAPRVWVDDGAIFTPVQVLSEEVFTDSEKLSRLEVVVSPLQKTVFQHL